MGMICTSAANSNDLGLRVRLKPWNMTDFGKCACADDTEAECFRRAHSIEVELNRPSLHPSTPRNADMAYVLPDTETREGPPGGRFFAYGFVASIFAQSLDSMILDTLRGIARLLVPPYVTENAAFKKNDLHRDSTQRSIHYRHRTHTDDRGFFARTFCVREFEEHGLDAATVQCNVSFGLEAGTLRGMHFQAPRVSEAKLVPCVRGGIHDIIVDLRTQSQTYQRHFAVELTAKNGCRLF